MKSTKDVVTIYEVMGHVDGSLDDGGSETEEGSVPRAIFACFPTEEMARAWVQASCYEAEVAAIYEDSVTVCADIVEITIPTSIVAELLCRQLSSPVLTHDDDVDKLLSRRLVHTARRLV